MLQIHQVIWGMVKMFKIIKDNEEIIIDDEIVEVLEYKAPLPLLQQIKDWIDCNYYQKVEDLANKYANVNPNKLTHDEKRKEVLRFIKNGEIKNGDNKSK